MDKDYLMDKDHLMNKTDITCIGQAVVDCITRGITHSEKGIKVHRAEGISLSIGGDAVNETTVLTRLGHHVRLVCAIGADPAGRLIYDTMKRLGADVSRVDIAPDRATPIANLLVEKDGSRNSYNSDATMLGDYAPGSHVTAGTKIVSLASLFRAPLDRSDTVVRLVREAKKNGAILCADTKLPTFRKIKPEEIAGILPLIDYIFPNDAEAVWLTGQENIRDAASCLRDAGVKNVIVKAGKDGCFVLGEDGSFHMEALPVKAIDGTGAGDNFVAGFLSGLLRGFSLHDCCSYGTVCAAACVVNSGAGGGVKSRQEADELWERWRNRHESI